MVVVVVVVGVGVEKEIQVERSGTYRIGMQQDAGFGGNTRASSRRTRCNGDGDAPRAEQQIPAEPHTMPHSPATQRQPLQG